MATTGTLYGSYDKNWRMKVEYSYTQSAVNNETYLTRKYYVYNGYASYNQTSNSAYYTIEGGSKVYEKYNYSTAGQWHLLETVTTTIKHDSSGKKTVTLSASWVSGHNGSTYTPNSLSISESLKLNDIDRSAPTVSLAISDITSNSIKISATASVTANKWDYSLDGGTTWTNFSTSEGTSANTTVTNLSPNGSYDICVRARKKLNNVYGQSAVKGIVTVGGSRLDFIPQITADNATVNIAFHATIYNASFYHKLIICDGDTEVVSTSAFTKTAGSHTDLNVTLTSAQRQTLLIYMSNMKSFSANVSLKTYSDYACTKQVGSESTRYCTVQTTEENSAPVFSNFTCEDSFITTKNLIGVDDVFLQNYSMLKIICDSATAKNYADIASYSVSIGNVSVTSINTTIDVGGINSVGNLEIVVTCSDSRGYATKVKKQIVVLGYSKPKISGKLRRKDEIDALIQLEFSGSFSSIKPDGVTEKNYISDITYKYKKTSEDDSAFCTPVSILNDTNISGTMISYENLELMELDKDSSFDFIITVTDVLGITTQYEMEKLLMSANPYLILLKANYEYDFPRVGVFNPKPQYPFDCNALANFAKGILIEGKPLNTAIMQSQGIINLSIIIASHEIAVQQLLEDVESLKSNTGGGSDGISGEQITAIQKEIDWIEKDIIDIQNEVFDLEQTIIGLVQNGVNASDLEELQTLVDALNGTFEEIYPLVYQCKSSIDYLMGTSTTDGIIPILQSDVSTLKNDVSSLKNSGAPQDSGWVDAYLGSNFERYNSSNPPIQVRKIGNVVHMRGIVKAVNAVTPSSDASTWVCWIPIAYAPSSKEIFICQGSNANRFQLTVNNTSSSAGWADVFVSRYTDSTTTNEQIPSGAQLCCYATWFVG